MRPNIIWFDCATSTQDVARRFAARKTDVVIVANRQTRGRGRFGRVWESAPGGLWTSLLVFPNRDADSLHYINIIGALAVIKLLEDCDLGRGGIVWPNDVMIRGRKIAGVLTERLRSAVVCGIGVNVNQTVFPTTLSGATSLRLESKTEYSIPELLECLIGHFYSYYPRVLEAGTSDLVDEYRQYLTMTNTVVALNVGSRVITGSLCDVDDEGRLVFRESNGVIRHLSCGQVQRVRWS